MQWAGEEDVDSREGSKLLRAMAPGSGGSVARLALLPGFIHIYIARARSERGSTRAASALNELARDRS